MTLPGAYASSMFSVLIGMNYLRSTSELIESVKSAIAAPRCRSFAQRNAHPRAGAGRPMRCWVLGRCPKAGSAPPRACGYSMGYSGAAFALL